MERAPSLRTVLVEWGRIGCLGFGGPPVHIRMLRDLCVERRGWIPARDFEDAVAVCNLLPGPASTQLSILCAWRLRGRTGAVVGGAAFILPGLALIVALAALFLAGDPPGWVLAAGAGAGAVVPVVALHAAAGLLPAGRAAARARGRAASWRWAGYVAAGAAGAATLGARLVLVLLACGLIEVLVRSRPRPPAGPNVPDAGEATLLHLAWTAFTVGALSYGGGFVIVPLMQGEAVQRGGWMTSAEFLNAVALGQVTPGPVVHTVAAVGYAAAGVPGALLAAVVAFAPSFVLVLSVARHVDRLRDAPRVRAFLDAAGPAAAGAIAGAAVLLAAGLSHPWQWLLLPPAALGLLGGRTGVVATLLAGAGIGILCAAAGLPV